MSTKAFRVVGGKDSGDKTPPNQSCVECLEKALSMAKDGSLQEVVLVGFTDDKFMVNGWSESKSVFSMLGALTQTVHDFRQREILQCAPEYRPE